MKRMGTIPVWRDIGASPDRNGSTERRSVIIVGAGPVGLTLALALGRRGHDVLVLEKRTFIAAASKAICFSKRSLDIWDTLGVADTMVERGVIWNVGKVFWGARPTPIYQFDTAPIKDQRMPGFINLQQYHCEEILLHGLAALPNVELRWGHELTGVQRSEDQVSAEVATPGGQYHIEAEWLIACDGAKSPARELLGLPFDGRVFEDNFLIADVKFKEERPSERWFWFDPAFNPGQSALLHKQPDDVWRLDFQLGPGIDKQACVRPEAVEPLVRGLLGPDVEFQEEWYSVYNFQCRRMERFIHGRVIFAGDSAHLVSPFGARGCNGGVADADNLAWKLDLLLRGKASVALLETYNTEAIAIADENILNSTRSTDFITPKSQASRVLRDAVLQLAEQHAFARPFVNSGRLSTAVAFANSPLSTPDEDEWNGVPPGGAATDAPLGGGWLLQALAGQFGLLSDNFDAEIAGIKSVQLAKHTVHHGVLRKRYDLSDGAAYLFRPDQYVAARWRQPNREKVLAALHRAQARNSGGVKP